MHANNFPECYPITFNQSFNFIIYKAHSHGSVFFYEESKRLKVLLANYLRVVSKSVMEVIR